MKGALLIVAVFGLPLAIRGAGDARPSAAHAALAQKIKGAFPYDPAASKKQEEKREPDGQVVVMERFTVVEPAPLRRLQEKMDAEREKRRAEELSFANGGALFRTDFKNVRIEVGPMGDGARVTFLRISW
jgi:hypothetical protein